jgi:hypothetical protein
MELPYPEIASSLSQQAGQELGAHPVQIKPHIMLSLVSFTQQSLFFFCSTSSVSERVLISI